MSISVNIHQPEVFSIRKLATGTVTLEIRPKADRYESATIFFTDRAHILSALAAMMDTVSALYTEEKGQ